MSSTRLSSKGQLVIPQEIRRRHGWTAGTKLEIDDHDDAVVIRKSPDLPVTGVDDLVRCVDYSGPRRSLREMEEAIAEGARRNR
jgi:AbrB family looped-hinge helix DNA binding protein